MYDMETTKIEEIEVTFGLLNRTNWRCTTPGPWDKEPDLLKFDIYEYQCLIIRSNTTGALNGYIGVPQTHPWHNQSSEDLNLVLDIHGGITHISTEVYKISVPYGGRWVGFDCSHSFDFMPAISVPTQHDSYRDIWFVMHECISLAGQARLPAEK